MSQLIDRIIVYRFGQIGDTVAALPALWAIRQQFPQSEIVLLSEVPGKSNHLPPETVLPATSLVDGFEKYPAGTSFRGILAARRCIVQLRKRGFRTLVYLVPSERSRKQRMRDATFFRLAGVKQLLGTKGFFRDGARHVNGMPLRHIHEADALLARLKEDGITVPAAGGGSMDLRITQGERDRAENWWRAQGNPSLPHGWIAVCAGAKVPSKLWPLERYAEVVQRLIRDHGVLPVIVGGPEDRADAAMLLERWKVGFCAAGELSVRESAALMSGARCYLGNDTGAMHLAAAVGLPCVAVFSARDWPGRWEPYGSGHRVLRFDVPCSVCKLEVCDKGLICLTNISVEQVCQACDAVLSARNLHGLI